MLIKKKNAIWGRYPCCDLVNNAIHCILSGDTDGAVEELLQAIWKSNGYLHKELKEEVTEIHERVWKRRNS